MNNITIRDVARHLGIGWDTFKEVLRTYLSSRFSQPDLKHLDLIAIDEIAIGKGHRYLTVVLNLISPALLCRFDGKIFRQPQTNGEIQVIKEEMR